jgi:hypothetical protein
MRTLLKKLSSKISIDTYQRLLAFSILKNEFDAIKSCQKYDKREALWDAVINSYGGVNTKITFVEFGVHEGYSINYFSSKNTQRESVFTGLDSFEGLPEDWGTMKKGSFDMNGKIPNSSDSRVNFIKGWFQDSWINLENQLSNTQLENLIVHYDADLYSSTLFALSKIDTLKTPYIAIFDEFTGHESRALYNYCQAYNCKIEFLGQTIVNNFPFVVACRITPNASLTKSS